MQHSFEHCIKKNENVLEFKLRKVIILGDNRRLKKKKRSGQAQGAIYTMKIMEYFKM